MYYVVDGVHKDCNSNVSSVQKVGISKVSAVHHIPHWITCKFLFFIPRYRNLVDGVCLQ